MLKPHLGEVTLQTREKQTPKEQIACSMCKYRSSPDLLHKLLELMGGRDWAHHLVEVTLLLLELRGHSSPCAGPCDEL